MYIGYGGEKLLKISKNTFKLLGSVFVVALVVSLASYALTNMITSQARVLGKETKKSACTTIQDGTLVTSAGDMVEPGFDQWGYNYQARIFNGTYCDAYRDAAWCQDYADDELIMKWNDAWLSNMDCDGDGQLDRHRSFDSYIGSGAWETNHQRGTYIGKDGKTHNWTYFVKIVAVPSDAVKTDEMWYTADGEEIGASIWGEFAIVEEVYNDPYEGFNGASYISPAGPGFGKYQP